MGSEESPIYTAQVEPSGRAQFWRFVRTVVVMLIVLSALNQYMDERGGLGGGGKVRERASEGSERGMVEAPAWPFSMLAILSASDLLPSHIITLEVPATLLGSASIVRSPVWCVLCDRINVPPAGRAPGGQARDHDAAGHVR